MTRSNGEPQGGMKAEDSLSWVPVHLGTYGFLQRLWGHTGETAQQPVVSSELLPESSGEETDQEHLHKAH